MQVEISSSNLNILQLMNWESLIHTVYIRYQTRQDHLGREYTHKREDIECSNI